MWGLLYIRSLANRPEGRQAGQQGWEGAQLKIRDERSKASVDGDEDSLRSERKGNHQPIPPDAGFKAALALVLYTEATWPLLQRQTGRTIQTPLASLPPHHLVHCSRLLGLTAGYRGEPIKKRKKKRNSGVLETESNASLPINHDPASPLLATIPTGHLVINSVGYEWSTELGVLNWGSWKNGLSPSIPPLETKKIKQAGYKIIHIK